MTMNTPDPLARAQAIHDEIARWKPVLERQGCTVTLELVPGRTGAGVVLSIVMRGTLAEARKQSTVLMALGRVRGFELSGGVNELFRDGLAPDEWRIGLLNVVHRPRAPRRKAA
jgi:hypothetical protein